MLNDLGHPYAAGEPVFDVTFENVQAGERTSHLFRLANHHNALVLGTGDLSEIALGWSTYGVGDQMSHYNVNASVPKTLIQYLIRWLIATGPFDAATNQTLQAILDTEISPELVPAGAAGADQPGLQSTEAKIGPYELQDFNAFHITRYGQRPSNRLACVARPRPWRLAGQPATRAPQRIRPTRHQALARRVLPALLRHEPIQAHLHAERPQGRRRITQPARRLARAERRRSRGLAG